MPVSFVTPVETTPVSVFVAVMVTPGISAFAASETVPLSVALLDWPNADVESVTHTKTRMTAESLLMFPPRKRAHRIIRVITSQLKNVGYDAPRR